MTFSEWVQTDAEKCVRIDLTAHDGTSQVSKYIASRYYFDDVNDIEYLDRLIDPLIIRRSLGGAFGRPEATVGAISIDNADRELDAWIDYAWHGWDVEIKLGDPSWSSDDSRWSVRFKGLADKMEAEDNILTLFTRDKSERLDRQLVERPLNMHPQSFLSPYPLALGRPKNVTPPMFQDVPPVSGGAYLFNAWNAGPNDVVGEEAVDPFYENGVESTKSTADRASIGGGEVGKRFDVNDPEGTVTGDPNPALDTPLNELGNELNKAGEILDYMFDYPMNRESGIARGGSVDTVVLDDNAVHQDDYYNTGGTVVEKTRQGYVAVFRRDSNEADEDLVGDQTGDTITFKNSMSFAVAAGDRYDIVPPDTIRMGPLETDEIDAQAFTDLDNDAGYDLGIWDGGGELTYLDLLDGIFPGGFYYFWKSDGKITAGLLKDPSQDTSVFTVDQYETRGKIRLVQDDVPIYRARVGVDKNWTVMKGIDNSVPVDRATFLTREYDWELDEDLTVLDEYPDAKAIDYPSWLLNRADGKTEAQRLMGLFGVARKRIMVEGLSGLFSVDLHDVVTLKDDTYGLNDGKDYRVVMMEERPMQGTVDVELWG